MSMTWGTKPIMQDAGTIVNVVTDDFNTVQNPTTTVYAANTHGDIVLFQGDGIPLKNLFVGNGSRPSVIAYADDSLFALPNGAVDNFQIIKLAGGSFTPFPVNDGGTPAMLGGGQWLYMAYPGAVMRSNGQPGSWMPITPPVSPGNNPGNSKTFAANKNTIFGILPDNTVTMYQSGTTWTTIRSQATAHIIAGGDLLCAIDASTGDIFKFNGPGQPWTQIGGPGKMFAIGDGGELYGLVPNGSEVVQWNGQPGSWSVVGPTAAGMIFAGGGLLCATSPDNQALWCYRQELEVLTFNAGV